MARTQPPPPPPRLSGKSADDLVMLVDWLQRFYQTAILTDFFLGGWTFGSVAAGGAATTFDVVFAEAEIDTNYNLVLTASEFTGAPADAAFVVVRQTRGLDKCTIQLAAAPGSGNTVTFNWHLRR